MRDVRFRFHDRASDATALGILNRRKTAEDHEEITFGSDLARRTVIGIRVM
jgi:hypothetical protein